MARIYRKTDRIKVKIGKGEDAVVLSLSPLSQHEKLEVQSLMFESRLQGKAKSAVEGVAKAIKFAVKAMEGALDSDNKPYQLEFEDGVLKDECVQDILNMELAGQIMFVCSALTSGVPSKFNDNKGEPLPDVEILTGEAEKKSITQT